MSATVAPYAATGVPAKPRTAERAAALRAAVGLEEVMSRTEGDPDVVVALLDGPVASGHPLLSAAHIRATAADGAQSCRATGSPACAHGTFIAGILVASRDSPVPGICPGCTLLSRPVFPERGSDEHPSAFPPTTLRTRSSTPFGAARGSYARPIRLPLTHGHTVAPNVSRR